MKLSLLTTLRAAIACIVAVAGIAPGVVAAQSYPNKPIRYIVGFPAGGAGDIAARLLGHQLGERLKQSIVVDNKPGANGRIGADAGAKATADGYTLVQSSAESHSINPVLYSNMPYSAKDFAMVAPYAVIPFAVVANVDIKASSMRDVVAIAKAQPGKLTSASWGVGSTSHLILELIKRQADIDVLHVPFQGEAPAVNALMGGQVDLMILPAIRAEILRKEGKVRVLAVTTGTRVSFVPDIPTLKEQGYDVDVANWVGVAAPAKTPRAIVEKLSSEINALQSTPAFVEGLAQIGMYPHPAMTPAQFQRFVEDDTGRWATVIQAAHIKAE